jgi:hypothetical protein
MRLEHKVVQSDAIHILEDHIYELEVRIPTKAEGNGRLTDEFTVYMKEHLVELNDVGVLHNHQGHCLSYPLEYHGRGKLRNAYLLTSARYR